MQSRLFHEIHHPLCLQAISLLCADGRKVDLTDLPGQDGIHDVLEASKRCISGHPFEEEFYGYGMIEDVHSTNHNDGVQRLGIVKTDTRKVFHRIRHSFAHRADEDDILCKDVWWFQDFLKINEKLIGIEPHVVVGTFVSPRTTKW